MRAFLAIELPSPVHAELAHLQEQLRASRADVKWVEEHNLHLTLRFLGAIGDAERALVESAGHHAVATLSPLTIELSQVGAFPSASSPRVVWVGIDQGRALLEALAADVEQGLVAAGLPAEDKRFSAHVTIGRVRSPRGRSELVRAMREAAWAPPAPFVVDHLTLFRSDLGSSGPTYSVVNTFRFGAG